MNNDSTDAPAIADFISGKQPKNAMSIFKKKAMPIKPTESTREASPPMKFDRPKILAIDAGSAVESAIREAGYNVGIGTFGQPYRVAKSSSYLPLIGQAKLPNYSEQEIIVIDVMGDDPVEKPVGTKHTPESELDWWVKCASGIADPRPIATASCRAAFNRIYESGGLFLIFADSRVSQDLVLAQTQYDRLQIDHKLNHDNWSFLPCLDGVAVAADFGEEISVSDNVSQLSRLLADHSKEGSFTCTLNADYLFGSEWIPLARNKYGAPVAGLIRPPKDSTRGWILICPRISKKGEFVAALLKDVLPELAPNLFPYAEGQKWVHRPEYELATVCKKELEVAALKERVADQISILYEEIEAERVANKLLYDLLRETGGNLVAAVQDALAEIGFNDVIDVDAEMKAQNKGSALREDLRIHDRSPVLVVDVKGVAGKPADAEALQAQKHAFIYIQEQNRADVRGLTIINHQRLIPPLDRENEMPYRQEILDNASQLHLGLMTTWDLFRLVRNMKTLGWRSEDVLPIFYRPGRILPIPDHYAFVGKVKQVWKAAFSVAIDSGHLKVGDRIAIEFPVDFDEQAIASIQLNNLNVEEAKSGSEVGLPRDESLPKLRPGLRVYRISVGEQTKH